MYRRTLEVHFNVDDGIRPHGESAYLWFSMLTDALAPGGMTELAVLPAVTSLDPYSDRPQGEPGQLYGFVDVTRLIDRSYQTRERRNLSTEGWAWLRSELVDMPGRVAVQIGRVTSEGQLGRVILKASVETTLRSPGWMVLEAVMPADHFTDPVTGRERQRAAASLAARAPRDRGQDRSRLRSYRLLARPGDDGAGKIRLTR